MKLRAVSNLSVPRDLRLPKSEQRTRFLFFYQGRFREDSALFVMSLAFQGLFPSTRYKEFLADKTAKAEKKLTNLGILSAADRTVIKKVTTAGKEGFVLECPLYAGASLENADEQKYFVERLIYPKQLDDAAFEPVTLTAGVIKASSILPHLSLSSLTKENLEKTFMGLNIEIEGGTMRINARFYLTQAECQFLTSTPFDSIRPANLYILLNMWVKSLYGDLGKMPRSSMPITHIVAAVKEVTKNADVTPRNKMNGIVVLESGDMAWIPDVDNSLHYEQALENFGAQEDGSFTFYKGGKDATTFKINKKEEDEDEGEGEDIGKKGKKLPVNLPIYTDWVNLKFSYSQTNGIMAVLDLERCVPLRPFHVRSFLETKIWGERGLSDEMKGLKTAFVVARQLDSSLKITPTKEELKGTELGGAEGDIEVYLDMACRAIIRDKLAGEDFIKADDFKILTLSTNSPVLGLRAVGRALLEARKIIQNNLEKAYERYSVSTTIDYFAKAIIFADYQDKYPQVVKEDEAKRSAYLHQGLDPKYKETPVPFIQDNIDLMPHQGKSDNLLREYPKSGVIDTDAGGGKTFTIILDVLRQLNAKLINRPLILCPSHLVAQYVKEAVYITQGRVNMVPITSYTIKQNGYKRLARLIEISPINTIFVSDYDCLSLSQKERVSYGIRPITIFKNVEFLRQFKFDYVAMDECHNLKNNSQRTDAVHRLISEIPVKRIASGTIIADTPKDLVLQFALIDPTIFGDEAKFEKDYAKEKRGDKVMAWKEGAQQMMRKKIREHAVFVSCRRKEWAALLPDPEETFYAVNLSETQNAVYQSILNWTMDQIKAAAAKKPALRKALEEAEDETKSDRLAALLKPYLARLEIFLAAPSKDKLGIELLKTKDDKQSPKTRKLISLCKKHLGMKLSPEEDAEEKDDAKNNDRDVYKAGKPLIGKILIFCNHILVAKDIYESLPPDLQAMTIHYKAKEKMEARSEFERNPKKLIMVGSEKSMNTGLNLQMVSRLIRVETVWTPGELEQGNARINRPNRKEKERRKFIYLDTIVVNNSFDITKVSRLIAKTIQKTKFDEAESGNPAFAAIPEPPLVAMTLKNIRENNSAGGTLAPYIEAYGTYKQVLNQDYKDYREQNKNEETAIPVPVAPLIPGSKLMSRTPYVPDMELYGADELGLVRYDAYIETELNEDEDEEDADEGEGEEESPSQRALSREETEKVKGLYVHTEYGEGEIVRATSGRLTVRLASGEKVNVRKMTCFIVTRANTNSKDIKTQLLKLSGKIPIDTPVDVPPQSIRIGKGIEDDEGPLPTTKVSIPKEGLSVELHAIVLNDFLGLSYLGVENAHVVSALSQLEFRVVPSHYTTQVKQAKVLITLFKAWKDKGLTLPDFLNKRFQVIYKEMKSKTGLNTFGLSARLGIANFYTRGWKADSDKTKIKPYTVVRDDLFYVVLPAKGQAGTQVAIKVPVSGIKWKKAGDDELIRFVTNKNEALDVIKKLGKAKIKITNEKTLVQKINKLRLVKRTS